MSTTYDPKPLHTVHMVPLTAFDASGELAHDVQAKHTARLYRSGIRVFLPAAGTSEFHSLSADEIVDLVRITREASGPDAQVFAPVGLQQAHAIDVGRRSVQAGANGVLFMPFVHPYLSDVGARDYYLEVGRAIGAPAMIYKKEAIPGDSLLLELADEDWVGGVKYSVNDMHAFRTVVLQAQGRLNWFCGSAERYAPFYMLAGATGYTTGAGNICPHLTLAMHAALAAGEYSEALRLQKIILPIEDYRARNGDSYNISMLKHAMTRLGYDFGAPRAPQRQLTAAERAEIDELIKPILGVEAELSTEFQSVGLSEQ